ncbi:hypothetical protein [Actinospongicola halichondriae]|uniref:hypothetical protein n=1 Tax=Actinospongicola halichondriae TaxID=3236844 RepID=UPI003D43931F
MTTRLRALGDEAVPDAVRNQHLHRMAAVPTNQRRSFGRAWVAAAAIVGFLAGSTGLAAAGALPDSAQDVAHDVLAVVQVNVPEGNRGACVSAIAKSSLPKDEKKAAKDACPKGGKGAADGAETPGGSATTPHADDPCRGKPPWAGRKDLTSEQKDALKSERRATCGTDDDLLDDQDDDDQDEDDQDLDDADGDATTGSSLPGE